MTDMNEHAGLLISIIGGLLMAGMAVLGFTVTYVIKDIKTVLKRLETTLDKFGEEMFERLRKVEVSLESLWTEHRMRKELGCTECHLHTHKRADD